jgi:fructose-bisphosphate aldolase class II
MGTLREILEQAETNGVAIGHFNVSDLGTLKAVFESARDSKAPVIVGTSEGERQFIGVRQIAAAVKSLREEYDFPIFLNADHTHSLPSAMEAAKAGFDWIVFDVSTLPFEENVRQTKAAVETLKSLRPDILVEGEIGDIGSRLGDSRCRTRPAKGTHDPRRSETVRGRNPSRYPGSCRW